MRFQFLQIENVRKSFTTWEHLVNESFQNTSILQDEHQKEVSYGNNSFNTGRFAGF